MVFLADNIKDNIIDNMFKEPSQFQNTLYRNFDYCERYKDVKLDRNQTLTIVNRYKDVKLDRNQTARHY